ncbi:TPA: host cell division inhibitor Icd-like protein [Escherichia coli]|uniref:host cell division inhibitor Icd-like protein n=3 Tax=Escherichia coli TaxID=562 RepID=UPI000AD22442|nr:host cell division inhibitor Icd-like protein [Escherichia coli]EHL0129462.1 host cell division inhibitor Icd-like protein [Escherichia coli]EHQ6209676.1 host cell division inhibitor Icd-like protein [Escherichia coli]EHS1007190.1 host cell division inhibitor Icd-like protein [Escherichia coli]EHS4974341.1 host cell division inhibitor Icd-like protein [Escherichia coli]EHV3392971.1 host cell division inhibitor Icd-like protein [Escherichia coli]
MKRPNVPVQGQGFVQPEISQNDILIRHKAKSRIDSRLFAERIGIKHKSLYSLIQKHKTGLRELGILPFQTERLKTNQHGEREHKFALLNSDQFDYMRHIVSHFAAERMKHVKQYLEEVLSNYRAGGSVRREYPHDAGMAGKTKATTKGSPVEIKEIKRITNYAMSVAGGQGYQPGGRFLVAFNRRGYFSTKSSRANFLAFVCDAFDSSSHVFPRLILFSIKREAAFLFSDESMGLLPVCCSTMASMSSWCCSCRKNFSSSGGKSILISCTAERRSTSHHGADGCYSFYGVREAKADRYRFLGEINRRGYLSRNASSANRFGLVRGEGLSKDSRSRRTFSRWRSSMDNAISCNSSFVIVCTRKAVRCSTSYHSAGIFYGCNLRDDSGRFATYCININNVMLLCAFKENAGIFRTNFSRNTSDHLSKKAAYTEAIPYKTGIGITTPQELEAIHDAPASFFVSAHTHTSTMVGCMGPTSVGLVSSNASCGNPVQSTASELTTSGGGYNPKVRGAFHMAVSARPYFVWRFMQCLTGSIAIFTVTAATEREARAQLPHAHLIFVARIRQEVTHA